MILFVLGALDILAATAMLFRENTGVIAVFLGMTVLLKGIISIVGSIGSGYYFDIMGVIDIVSGLSLCSGFVVPFLWILLFLKGVFSMLSSPDT